MEKKEFWFVVGSQSLYGEEVLKTVEKRVKWETKPWSPKETMLTLPSQYFSIPYKSF